MFQPHPVQILLRVRTKIWKLSKRTCPKSMIYEAGKATVNTQPIKRYHLLKLVTIHDVGRDLVNHGYRDKKLGI